MQIGGSHDTSKYSLKCLWKAEAANKFKEGGRWKGYDDKGVEKAQTTISTKAMVFHLAHDFRHPRMMTIP